MKVLVAVLFALTLSACSTTAGFVQGIGEDIKAGTDWTASKIKPN